LRAAGINPDHVRPYKKGHSLNRRQIVEAVLERKCRGQSLRCIDVRREDCAFAVAAKHRFGSWPAALVAAEKGGSGQRAPIRERMLRPVVAEAECNLGGCVSAVTLWRMVYYPAEMPVAGCVINLNSHGNPGLCFARWRSRTGAPKSLPDFAKQRGRVGKERFSGMPVGRQMVRVDSARVLLSVVANDISLETLVGRRG
jgi:hypothetical protein